MQVDTDMGLATKAGTVRKREIGHFEANTASLATLGILRQGEYSSGEPPRKKKRVRFPSGVEEEYLGFEHAGSQDTALNINKTLLGCECVCLRAYASLRMYVHVDVCTRIRVYLLRARLFLCLCSCIIMGLLMLVLDKLL